MSDRACASVAVAAALAVAACGAHEERASGETAALSSGVAALVGADALETELVAQVAASAGKSPKDALDALVFDALFAAGARERFGATAVHHAEVTARARALLESFRTEAVAKGAPTADELAEATADHFWELDRPVFRRTTHFVALVEKPEEDARARAVAERVLAAVSGARDAVAFRTAATAVPADVKTRVEDLDPVAQDGRVVNPASPPGVGKSVRTFSSKFAEAAFQVPAAGDKTGVVRTEFGFHVILVTEILPELRVPETERRTRLAPEIVHRRMDSLVRAVKDRAKAENHLEFERAAVELTEKVRDIP